ncbi:hypothetical protein DH2020_001050 [Rehmannia glutinosa]|uniref:Reverse transcriptase Ty1/copia-type domain-containing protein n=1 Tax=Rehmannia glutinosa TaxID=99300 RepID=A0ABR0XYL0_REHGL
MSSIRVVLGIAASLDLEIEQLDVKTAFLHGDLNEEIYMEQPEGFKVKCKENLVCRLKKSLYGLKQAPRQWYKKFDSFMTDHDYNRTSSDHCVFFKKFSDNDFIILLLYVDDMLIIGHDASKIEKLKKELGKSFAMKDLGPAKQILGLQVKQLKDGTFISQTKYTRDLIKKFGMEEKSSVKIPMNTSVKMDMDADGKVVDETRYRALIGSLLYLTASMPDITFAVGVCARFQFAPKESHMTGAKRILRYMKGCQEVGLWYPKEGGFKLIGYSDSDYAGCRVDKKSTSGTCQMLGNRLVSWFSKKQNSIATSIAEAEYIAAGSCCSQVLWMRQQLRDYEIEEKEIPIMGDNTSAIAITQSPVFHSRTKHIDVRFHFIRDHIEKKDITLEYISTDKQLADIFTKPLCESRFEELKHKLGLIELS